MNRSLLPLLLLCALAPAVCGCVKDHEASSAVSTRKPAVAVETRIAAGGDFTRSVSICGNLTPKIAVDVRTQIVELIREVYVSEWTAVKKADPLLAIDTTDIAAELSRAEAAVAMAGAELSQARAELGRVLREKERTARLYAAGLATEQNVDEAASTAEATQARVEAAEARVASVRQEVQAQKIRLTKGLVLAPMDGLVAEKNAHLGALTSDSASSEPVFRIVNRVLELTATVAATEAGRVREGQLLEFTVDPLPGRTFNGTIKRVNPEFSSQDRSLKVIAEVDNADLALKGGLFIRGRIIIEQRQNVVSVPRQMLSAWDPGQGRANLFVMENDHARLRTLETGQVEGELIEIRSGLAAGEAYVCRGGFTLKDGDPVLVAAAACQPQLQSMMGYGYRLPHPQIL